MNKKIGILGATGFTGLELLGLLNEHPEIDVSWLTSERHAGKSIFELFPHLQGRVQELFFITTEEALKHPVDGIFSCLPHQTAAEGLVPFIDGSDAKIVDLSADFRMRDLTIYEKYYTTHPRPELLPDAVYGIPEWNKEEVAQKRIIGNPGCYPTSILLPLKPLAEKGWIDVSAIISDSKSGVSGAGKNPTAATHFCEVHESFSAYKVADEHRHISELNEQLSIASGKTADIIFTPHLIPMEKGILSTIYVPLTEKKSRSEILDFWKEYYQEAPFVEIIEEGFPKTSWVRDTNRCMFGAKVLEDKNMLVVVSVIDNLVKGASGQALQNMNIALGIDEKAGLR
jgi:N-acetyl-gamma-glutamyl-phosphate reductase